MQASQVGPGFLLGLALFLGCTAASNLEFPPPATPILNNVPLVRQSTDYSCGAAALQSVLDYYGSEFMETEVMAAAHTNKDGTEIENIVAAAKQTNLKAESRVDATIEDLAESIRKNNPVIVEIQAWPDTDSGQPEHPYPQTWSEGHYVVAIGVDSENIYFMDPSILGGRGFISVAEFLDRWHEVGSKGEHLRHPAIFFDGIPNPPKAWQPIP